MAIPGTFNLTGKYAVYSGSDWAVPFGFYEAGGRLIDDLVLTDGSTAATSATAAFTAADTGKKIATHDGSGVVDSATMTYVSATAVTLSVPATDTGTFVATVRALNCSSYTNHTAEAKRAEGRPVYCSFAVDVTRNAVGWHELTLPEATTEPLSGNGVWDWRVEGPNGVSYWLAGKVLFRKNVTGSTP